MGYRLPEIGGIILGLFTAIQPVNAQSIESALHHSASYTIPADLGLIGCPTPEEAKKMIPEYGLENAVAEFPFDFNGNFRYGNRVIPMKVKYKVIAYDSKSKAKQLAILKDGSEINKFLERGEFDIAKIYETYETPIKPSGVIYRSENTAYTLFDVDGVPDGEFDYTICSYWKPTIVQETLMRILVKRAIDSIIEDGLIPVMPIKPEEIGI